MLLRLGGTVNEIMSKYLTVYQTVLWTYTAVNWISLYVDVMAAFFIFNFSFRKDLYEFLKKREESSLGEGDLC